MARGAQAVEAPTEEAQGWLRYSLEQGFDVSAAVLDAGYIDHGRGLAIVSAEFQRTSFNFSQGGVLGTDASAERLGSLLEEDGLGSVGAVLVEDDVMGKGDPWISKISYPSAFIRDRVLHWADLEKGTDNVLEVVQRGAFGYPLNAFLVSKSSVDLGLSDREEAPTKLP